MATPIKPDIATKEDYALRPSVPSNKKQNATEFNLLVSAVRANYERLILDWATDIVINTNLLAGQYVRFTDNFLYRITTGYNVGNPLTWVSGNAIAVNSDASKFKGVYIDSTALAVANPTGEPGDYAYVDAGVGNPVELWMWDDDDEEWVQSGSGGVGTVTSVSGTTNRITSTGGATPVIDIDAAYDAAIVAAAVAAVPDSSETVKGIIEIATQAETNTGTDDVRALTPLKVKNLDRSVVALTDASTVDLTGPKHTLTHSASTRTFTISHTGDEITMIVTLNAVAAVYTFPVAALCISGGVASGDNTCSVVGDSGDKHIFVIRKVGSTYLVVTKNFGQ